METSERSFKVMAWVVIALLTMSTVGALHFWNKSRDIDRAKDRVEQRLDSLKVSNGQLEQESRNLNDQLETARNENQSLTGQVTEVNGVLTQKEAQLRNLRNSNTNLTVLRDTMQNQVASLTEQSERMTEENQLLANTNNELSQRIEALNRELEKMVPRSVVTADGFRVEPVKHNDKVTAKAKKVHALTVSFNVPAALKLEGTREVYLSLNEGNSNDPIQPLRTVTVDLSGTSQTIPVHAVQQVDFSKGSQPISLTIESADDFQPRTYRASVFTKDAYLGSVEFTLRDSFWFF